MFPAQTAVARGRLRANSGHIFGAMKAEVGRIKVGPAKERKTMKTSMTVHKKATLAVLGMLGMFILTVLYGVLVMGIR